MSRVAQWLDSSQQAQDTQLEIMNDKLLSVNVYRYTAATNSVGFTSEVGAPTRLRTIDARIDNSKELPDNGTDPTENTQPRLVAITDDGDVRVNDVWQWRDITTTMLYCRVVRIRPTESGTEVGLDQLKRGII